MKKRNRSAAFLLAAMMTMTPVPLANQPMMAVTAEDTEPTLPVICTAPQFTGAETPLQIGETRKIKAFDPAGRAITRLHFDYDADRLSIDYTPGDDVFYVTGLAAGGWNLAVSTDVTAFIGYLQVNVAEEVYVPEPVLGDINGDLETNAADSADLLMEAAMFGASQKHFLSEAALQRADTDDDGVVNAGDAANILEYAAAVGAAYTTRDFPRYMEERDKTVFGWSCYRADGDAMLGKTAKAFQTREQLETYLASLSEAEKKLAIGTQTLDSETEAYNDAFFANRALLLIPCIPVSGSCTLGLDSVTVEDHTCHVRINLEYPEVSTTNEVNWYVLVETSKNAAGCALDVAFDEQQPLTAEVETSYPEAQYVRVSSGESFATKPITALRSRAELEAYFGDLTAEDEATKRLAKAVERYDDAYFAQNAVILVPRECSSGSHWFEVTGWETKQNRFTVRMNCYYPMVVTCDMAEWYIFVEVPQDAADVAEFAADINKVQEPGPFGDDLNAGEHLMGEQYTQTWDYRLCEKMDGKPVQFASREELEAYFADIPMDTNASTAPSVCLGTALERYTDTFFRYQNVLLIPMSVANCNETFDIQSVGWDYAAGEFVVKIDHIIPEGVQPLEAGWYLFAEVDKNTYTDMMRVEVTDMVRPYDAQ